MSDFTSAARSLALPIDDENDSWTRRSNNSNSNSPAWRRRSQSESTQPRNPSATTRWLRSANRLTNKLQRAFLGLTPIQQGGLVALNVALLIFGILFAVYNERIFAYLSPAAKRWRDTPGGWLVLWALTFFVSFPPMIGYSTCVTVAGFVWGMYGWFIVASATIIGSTASFIVSRTVLRKYVSRLAERNKRFAALSLVLKHDGIMLLIMIRLCPLPYSFSNGAISTIPTVTWQNYMLATACITPKLLLHIFVGRQIGLLAEEGSKMDFKTKMISYLSIAIGMAAGIATGYFIYVKTKARAEQLEAEEAAAAGTGANGGEDARRRMSDAGPDYLDDPDVEAAALRRDPDDFSLHTTYADDERGGAGRGGYLDDFTDDEDARERDVFDDGDGSMTGDEEDGRRKGER